MCTVLHPTSHSYKLSPFARGKFRTAENCLLDWVGEYLQVMAVTTQIMSILSQ